MLAKPYQNIPAPGQPCPAYSNCVCAQLRAPSCSPSPALCTAPRPAVTRARTGTGQSDPERPHPLQHCWWMNCYSIPGWELSCAGAVAASRQDTVLEVPEVPGPPPAEPAHTHPSINLSFSTAKIKCFYLNSYRKTAIKFLLSVKQRLIFNCIFSLFKAAPSQLAHTQVISVLADDILLHRKVKWKY